MTILNNISKGLLGFMIILGLIIIGFIGFKIYKKFTKFNKIEEYIMILIRYSIFFLIGGSIYCGIELLWRGHTHESMFIVGGICFILIGLINNLFSFNMGLVQQVILADMIVLSIEFFVGVYVNIYLGLAVWDYSNVPFNLCGQICLGFALLWIPVILFAIVLDDWIRYKFLGEEKPKYKII